jgi:hypothetical protein
LIIIFAFTMADPKSYLDPDARRGQPHSQFWYQLSINDPEGLRAMEDMVIAQHQKPITTVGHHEEHHDEEPPDVVSATAQGAVSAEECVSLSVSKFYLSAVAYPTSSHHSTW